MAENGNGNVLLRVMQWLQPIVSGVLLLLCAWIGNTLMEVRQNSAVLTIQMKYLTDQADERKQIIALLNERMQKLEVQVAVMTKALRHD